MSPHQLREEGQRLARSLSSLRDERPFVLAIPRGGVIIADAVACALRAPLDVLVVGKTVATARGAAAFGAVAEGGASVADHRAVAALGLSTEDVERLLDLERERQTEMLERMRGAWPLPVLAGRTAVLVDDAVVTGLTMRAAIAAVRARRARRIAIATPLCATEAATALAADADEVVYSASAPGPLVARMHDDRERERRPPIGDAEIHDMIVRELRDVGADPFEGLMIDGL